MKPRISLRQSLQDPNLLGGALTGESWAAWRTLLVASMGEVLREDEREIFSNLTGRDREPLQRIDQFAAVIGRRGGKSRAMATLACYLAGLCEHTDALVPGERGVLLCVALDQRVAKIVLDYAEASFERSPILKQLIASRTADALELTNGITLEVRPASFRKLRGPTHVAVIADERVIVERHRVDQPTISGRSRANLGHYKPLFACDDCTFASGRRCAFFTGESTSRSRDKGRFLDGAFRLNHKACQSIARKFER